MVKKTKKKDGQTRSSFSGYALFTKKYYNKNKGKMKSLDIESVSKAWEKLSDEEKDEYNNRAKELRDPTKSHKYVVPFHTRCAPKQFMEVCQHIKREKNLMDKLKKIGFDRLVEVCCPKIQRDVCRELMCAFDTMTNKISIRGKTREIKGEDVHKLMGIPYGGKEIKPTVDKENEAFKQLKGVYGKLAYKTIGSRLTDENHVNDFEFLFVMYALGTMLCPTASVGVSDRVLKVMLSTRDALGEYDWSSYVLNELCNSIEDYKEELRKDDVTGTKNVGGCIYFLMIYCFQHFPLGGQKASIVEDALQYWDEMKVHERVKLEKENIKGMLHVQSKGRKFCPETDLTHPEIKKTYKRLVSILGEEMMALQRRLMQGSDNEGEAIGKNEQDVDSDADESGAPYLVVVPLNTHPCTMDNHQSCT